MMTRKKFMKTMREKAAKGPPPSISPDAMWLVYQIERVSRYMPKAGRHSSAVKLEKRLSRLRRELEEWKSKHPAETAMYEARRTIPLSRTIRELDEKFRTRSEGL